MIVNADDYGHTPGVSDGIRDSHLHGIVTSTTAMMNMPGVEETLHKASQECPRLGLGVHLVLTSGIPLLPTSQLPSLIAGHNSFPDEMDLIQRIPLIDQKEVSAEWHAQVERFVSVTGHTPDHLDSHHHISFLSPGLFRVMLELSEKYQCAIRFPTGEAAIDMVSDLPVELAQECLESNLRLLNEYHARHPEHFIKSFYGENATRPALLDLLLNLPNGTTEIMCHPGYTDEVLMGSSTYHQQREAELSIFTDGKILALVKERNIELINFGDL
ncbi:MAG: ChbG/HpnK family deacetylase [Chloroflexi bacterium]|nr:ChbG/HpnK family deacetylase [Chloroflexota bacterium]